MLPVCAILLLLSMSLMKPTVSLESGLHTITSLLHRNGTYDLNQRPGIHSGKPVVVTIELFITSISDVSAKHMSYSVNVMLIQRWTDDRLQFSNDSKAPEMVLNLKDIDKIWLPDVYFPNMIDGDLHDLTLPNVVLTISPAGEIKFIQRFALTLACHMDFYAFPVDDQTCYLELESFSHTDAALKLEWYGEKPKDSVRLKTGIRVAEFFVEDIFLANATGERFNTTGHSSIVLMAAIVFHRQLLYYIVQIYIPSTMIVMLSWLSFWLDVHAVPARISLGIMTVLTINTQSHSANSQLPNVSYMKALDVWVATCIVFVCAAVVEFALANVLSRRSEHEQKHKSAIVVDMPLVEDGQKGTQKRKRRNRNRGLLVDRISRIIFPVAFLVFVFAYWIPKML